MLLPDESCLVTKFSAFADQSPATTLAYDADRYLLFVGSSKGAICNLPFSNGIS